MWPPLVCPNDEPWRSPKKLGDNLDTRSTQETQNVWKICLFLKISKIRTFHSTHHVFLSNFDLIYKYMWGGTHMNLETELNS
jgi:hypothetical protein